MFRGKPRFLKRDLGKDGGAGPSNSRSPPSVVPRLQPQHTVWQRPLYVDLTVNGFESIRFLIDTGADVTVMSLTMARELGLELRRSPDMLYGVGNVAQTIKGVCTVLLEKDGKAFLDEVVVLENQRSPLLGRPGLVAFSLLHIRNDAQIYRNLPEPSVAGPSRPTNIQSWTDPTNAFLQKVGFLELMNRLQDATASDPILKQVLLYCCQGWPKESKLSQKFLPIYKIRNSLFIHNGVLFCGTKCLVPNKLKHQIISEFIKSKNRVTYFRRNLLKFYFWPGIEKDVEAHIRIMNIREINRKYLKNSEVLPSDQIYGARTIKFGTHSFLVMIDFGSYWMELRPLENHSPRAIIDQFQEVFPRLGYPGTLVAETIIFSSPACKAYLRRKSIQLIPVTPPAAEGITEDAVRGCKRLLKAALEDGVDFRDYLFLYNHSRTPGFNSTPFQVRNFIALLPGMPDYGSDSLWENYNRIRHEVNQEREALERETIVISSDDEE